MRGAEAHLVDCSKHPMAFVHCLELGINHVLLGIESYPAPGSCRNDGHEAAKLNTNNRATISQMWQNIWSPSRIICGGSFWASLEH